MRKTNTQQFHWSNFRRALVLSLALPLGCTALRGESLMVNFIGTAPPLEAMAALEGVHVHLYGKQPKPHRKIGHATLTAADSATLEARLRLLEPLLDQSG